MLPKAGLTLPKRRWKRQSGKARGRRGVSRDNAETGRGRDEGGVDKGKVSCRRLAGNGEACVRLDLLLVSD